MARDCAPTGTDRRIQVVHHASVSDLTAATWIWWVWPTYIGARSNARLMWKGSGAGQTQIFVNGSGAAAAGLRFVRNRATTASNIITTGAMTLGQWQLVAIADDTVSLGRWYRAVKGGPLRDITNVAGSTLGVGTPTTDAGGDLSLGGRIGTTTPSEYRIGVVWVYNRRLMPAEITLHRDDPDLRLAGCVLHQVWGPGGVMVDRSGKANHGVPTDAPWVPHSPASMSVVTWPEKRPQRRYQKAAVTTTNVGWVGAGWW